MMSSAAHGRVAKLTPRAKTEERFWAGDYAAAAAL